MKSIKTSIIVCLLGAFTACQGQVEKKEPIKTQTTKEVVLKDTVKQMNLLDEQTKVFGSVFNTMGADNPFGDATNYREYIENSEMPEEQKQQIQEMYELYDASLDPERKEELKLRVDKMLKEAMEKGNTEN